MKKSSRNWTPEEDKMLEQIYTGSKDSKKLKWEQIAEVMHKKIDNCQKTGKQCRERWHNHLAPELNNSSQWTKQQNNILFQKHSEIGNKWAKIATCLKGRTDNCVKNHFYSTLRRGMRKVNNFIHEQRKQRNSIKQFKPDVLSKILIIADGDPQQKLNAKNNAQTLSKKIKQLLIKVSLDTDQDTYDGPIIDQVINLIMEFNKNCKKRKGKKKGATIQKIIDQQKDSELQQDKQQESQQISQSPINKIDFLNIKKNDKSDKQSINQQLIFPIKKQVKKQEDLINYKSFQLKNCKNINNQIVCNTEQIFKSNEQKLQQQNQQQIIKQEHTQVKRSRVKKSVSLVSQVAQLPNQTFQPVGMLFHNSQPTNGLFNSSGIDINFTSAVEEVPANKMFAASQNGIQNGQVFANFSQVSDHSFFNKLQGDKGMICTDSFQNSDFKKSEILSKSKQLYRQLEK